VGHAVLEALQAQVAAVREAQPARLGLQGAESAPGQPTHAAHDGRGLQAEGAGALLHCRQPFSASQLLRRRLGAFDGPCHLFARAQPLLLPGSSSYIPYDRPVAR